MGTISQPEWAELQFLAVYLLNCIHLFLLFRKLSIQIEHKLINCIALMHEYIVCHSEPL